MGILFRLITQFRNLTPHRIEFQVRNGLCPVPDLAPEQTRIVKQHRILRRCREHGPYWTIGVFSAGKYTGVELSSEDLLIYVRVVFRSVTNSEGRSVLRVQGVPENCNDYLLRIRCFGCLRNSIWDKRPTVLIGREDSKVATKLRKMEASSFGQQAGPLTATPLQQAGPLTDTPLQQAGPLTSTPLQQGSHVRNPSKYGKFSSDSRHVTTEVIEDVATDKDAVTSTHMRTKEEQTEVIEEVAMDKDVVTRTHMHTKEEQTKVIEEVAMDKDAVIRTPMRNKEEQTEVMEEVAMDKDAVTRTPMRTKEEQTIPVANCQLSFPRSSTSEKFQNQMDSFVYAILFLLALGIVLLVHAFIG